MVNPWLKILAADYEGHMGSPNVDQLSFLANTFRDALNYHDCDTVALLGCATGKGFGDFARNLTICLPDTGINIA